MFVSQKTKDTLIFMIPIMYVVSIILAIMGHGFIGIFSSVIITAIQLFLGLVSGDKVDRKLVWVLVIGFIIVHGGGLVGAVYYHHQFQNNPPSFLIMGMHPSWFYFMVVYWLGSFIYQSFALVALQDLWLPQEKWDQFLADIKEAQLTSESATVEESQ